MARKGKNTVEVVRSLALPVAEEHGVLLWDVRFEKEGGDWMLKILIDKADGSLSIDDCVNVNRAMDRLLDEADPIEQSYTLEVSSPGIDRELRTDFHKRQYLGKAVAARLIRQSEEGRRDYVGTLGAVLDDAVCLVLEDGREVTLQNKDLAYLRAYFNFETGGPSR